MIVTRALLVGVNEYSRLRREVVAPGQRPQYVNKSMSSAKADVDAIHGLIEPSGRIGPGIRKRTGPGNTTRDRIRDDLDWLFMDAKKGEKLLFYFSGHSLQVANSTVVENSATTHVKEVLCPSDVDWADKSNTVSDYELLSRARFALRKGACVEIILETCSASGIVEKVLPVYGFGSFFDGNIYPAGSGVAWCAAQRDESSHSGPIPACHPDKPVVGLFTHYFCEGYKANPTRSRQDLLKYVTDKLGEYFRNGGQCCDNLGPQTPRLMALSSARLLRAFAADCSAMPHLDTLVRRDGAGKVLAGS